ncbi:MAG: radical SAM protein [Candidatus Diapherotrites archaeon]
MPDRVFMGLAKKAALAGALARPNLGISGKPYKLIYAVTYKCNMKCKQCLIWKKKPRNELSLGEIESFFRNSQGLCWVDLTGGEPALRKDIFEIIPAIFENSKKLSMFHFPTNGFLTDRIYQMALESLKFRPEKFAVTISLDGPETLHDRLHGRKNSWQHAVSTYKLLSSIKQKGFEVKFAYTASNHNAGMLAETFLALREEVPELRPEDMHFNLAHFSKHYYGNSGLEEKLDAGKISRDIAFLRKSPGSLGVTRLFGQKYLSLAGPYLASGITPVPCTALSSFFFMAPDGSVFPCTIFGECLGNIRDHGFSTERLFGRAKYGVALKKIREGNCPQCWSPCQAYPSLAGSIPRLLT